MFHKILTSHTLSVAFAATTLLSGHAGAQTQVPAPPDKPTEATPAPFKSAFEGYQAYSDDKTTNWKAANDEVARIGGWREYAKQAQQSENTPTKTGEFKPKATP